MLLTQHPSLKSRKQLQAATKNINYEKKITARSLISEAQEDSSIHNRGQRLILLAHTQMKRKAEPECHSGHMLNVVTVCLVQAFVLRTSISVVSPSSVSDPSKALSRINFPSYTQATAQFVCVHTCVCVAGGRRLQRAPVPCRRSQQPPCRSQPLSAVTWGAHSA